MAQYLQINSDDCKKINDDNDDWRNATQKEFNECTEENARQNMYFDSENPDGKFVKNTHKKKPFCVRCLPDMNKEISLRELVTQVEHIANSLRPSNDTYHKDLELLSLKNTLQDHLIELKTHFPDTNKHQNRTLNTKFKTPSMGCLDHSDWPDANEYVRQNPSMAKSNSVVLDTATNNYYWNRPYMVEKNGTNYCVSIDDESVSNNTKEYHNLKKLHDLKNTDGVSWPTETNGTPLTTHEVYDRAAFCAQLNKETCGDERSSFRPLLIAEDTPKRVCKWEVNVNDRQNIGECVPNFNGDGVSVSDQSSSLHKWWKKFSEEERKLASEMEKKKAYTVRWHRKK